MQELPEIKTDVTDSTTRVFPSPRPMSRTGKEGRLRGTTPRMRLQQVLRLGVLGLCGLALSSHASLPAGVGFSFSRVVLMAEKRGGASVAVTNNTDNVYLMQARIQKADAATGLPVETPAGTPPPPFVVLPPLKRTDAHSELPLRIMVTPDNALPKNRESVFFLTVKAIPSVAPPTDKEKGQGRVILALANSIKLFYRPAGLKDAALADVAKTLTVQRSGSEIKVTNPSPYYITFSSLSVNGKAVDNAALAAMVPPYGARAYPLPAGVSVGKVSWRLIDEYGLLTDAQQAAID